MANANANGYADQITKEKWDALSNHKKWNVITALRGPDSPNPIAWMLKRQTTAVLRWHMFNIYQAPFGCEVNPYPTSLRLPKSWLINVSTMESGVPDEFVHFVSHLIAAAEALGLAVDFVLRDDCQPETHAMLKGDDRDLRPLAL